MTELDDHGQPLVRALCAHRVTERQIDEFIGVCKGVLADGKVRPQEIRFIKKWLDANQDAARLWPCNVLRGRLARVETSSGFDADSEGELINLLLEVSGGPGIREDILNFSTALPLDDPPPAIDFLDRAFCVTGRFMFGTRAECEGEIHSRGGLVHRNPKRATDYLVIGVIGSRDWIHSSHGRKIERALELRQRGHRVNIVSEDHWSAHLEACPPTEDN